MLEMCELKFLYSLQMQPLFKKVNSILKLGMKEIFLNFCISGSFFVDYNSRKNYSNLSFYLKQTSLCIMNTFKLPFGIYKTCIWSYLCFSIVVNLDSGIGVWWCNVLLTSGQSSYSQKDFELEEHIFNSPLCLGSRSSFQVG